MITVKPINIKYDADGKPIGGMYKGVVRQTDAYVTRLVFDLVEIPGDIVSVGMNVKKADGSINTGGYLVCHAVPDTIETYYVDLSSWYTNIPGTLELTVIPMATSNGLTQVFNCSKIQLTVEGTAVILDPTVIPEFHNVISINGRTGVVELNPEDISIQEAIERVDVATLTISQAELDRQAHTEQELADFRVETDAQIEAELLAKANGNPKGGFATVAALQAAFPTGTEGVYLVSADDHKYYWNGVAWIDGGPYLPLEPADGSITYNKLDGDVKSRMISANSKLVSSLIGEYEYSGNVNPNIGANYSGDGIPNLVRRSLKQNDDLSDATLYFTDIVFPQNSFITSAFTFITFSNALIALWNGTSATAIELKSAGGGANVTYIVSSTGVAKTSYQYNYGTVVSITPSTYGAISNKESYETLLSGIKADLPASELDIYTDNLTGNKYLKTSTGWVLLTIGTVYYDIVNDNYYLFDGIEWKQKLPLPLIDTPKLADSAVTLKKTTFGYETANLFDVYNYELIQGYYGLSGIFTPSPTYPSIKFVVEGGKTYTLSKYYGYLNFWDSSDTIISSTGAHGTPFITPTITMPVNCAYITITIQATYDLFAYMIVEGEILPSAYVPYLRTLSVKENKDYFNKRLFFIGDSITKLGMAERGWCRYFNEYFRTNSYVNTAQDGATWRDKTADILAEGYVYDGNPVYGGAGNNNTLGNQVQKIINNNYEAPDIIVIAAGTNDTNNEIDPDIESQFTSGGSVVPLENVNRMTFAGAMRYIVETLRSLYPTAQIFVSTPIQGAETLRTYASIKNKSDIIKEVASRLSIPVIDTLECGIYGLYTQDGVDTGDLIDGLHPNINGAKKIGTYIARKVASYYSI